TFIGESARSRAYSNSGRHGAAICAQLAGMSEFSVGPVRHGMGQFGNNGLDAVLGGQVHLAIIIVPIIVARLALNGRPHEPVAEHIEPVFGGNTIIARPVLLGGIGLAKIDGAEGRLRKLVEWHGAFLGKAMAFGAAAPSEIGVGGGGTSRDRQPAPPGSGSGQNDPGRRRRGRWLRSSIAVLRQHWAG